MLDQPVFEAVLSRLERLERSNRRWRACAGAVVFGCALLAVLGANAPAGSVRARQFELVDSTGNVEARLEIAALCKGCQPRPGLFFGQADDKATAYITGGVAPSVGVSSGSASAELFAISGTSISGTSVFRLATSKGAIDLAATDTGSVLDISSSGRMVVLRSSPGVDTGILLQSGDQELASLTARQGLRMWDPSGPPAGCPPLSSTSGKPGYCGPEVQVSADTSGPNLSLFDPRGFGLALGVADLASLTTGETHRTSAASIVMFGSDKDHHVIWQAPSQ